MYFNRWCKIIDVYYAQIGKSETAEYWSYNRANNNTITFKDDLEAIANIGLASLKPKKQEKIQNAINANHRWYDIHGKDARRVRTGGI